MWDLTLRNLRYRRRQLLVAAAGTALIFAMTLLVSGMSAGFGAEAARTLAGIGEGSWVVPANTPGPFGSLAPEPGGLAAQLASEPGVGTVTPLVIIPEYVSHAGQFTMVTVLGHPAGARGEPAPDAGRPEAQPGEAVIDSAAGIPLGGSFSIGRRSFHVVGTTTGRTINAGQATVYMSLADAQALAFGGRDLVSAVLVSGQVPRVPSGYQAMSADQVRSGLLRPLRNAQSSIGNTRIMLWVVAVAIVAGVMYVSALERVRDFAVLKAVGARAGSLVGGLVAEAVLLTLASAAVSIGFAHLLRPAMKGMPISFTAGAAVATVIVAVVVGATASVSGVRRVLRTDPARAFGS